MEARIMKTIYKKIQAHADSFLLPAIYLDLGEQYK